MHHHRTLAVLVSLAVAWCTVAASAAAKQTPHEALIAAYLDAAFGNTRQVILKPEGAKPLTMGIYCRTGDCDTISAVLLTFLPPGFYTRHSNIMESQIAIVLYDKVEDIPADFKEVVKSGEALYGEGREDCRLGLVVSGDVIKKIRILASTRAEAKRIAACVVVQVFRGIGLVLPERMNFEQMWSFNPDGLEHVTDTQLRQFFSALRVMSGVHLCADIKAGMGRDAVAEILNKTSSCISEVVPSNAQ